MLGKISNYVSRMIRELNNYIDRMIRISRIRNSCIITGRNRLIIMRRRHYSSEQISEEIRAETQKDSSR